MPKTKTTWKKGQSGNPKGRKPGTGRTSKIRAALEANEEALIKKVGELALNGDTTALRLCIERLYPPIKSRDEPVVIENLSGDETISSQAKTIIDALSDGKISPDEASTIMQVIANQARIFEIDELEKRIAALEETKL